jgi:hypothetical protein
MKLELSDLNNGTVYIGDKLGVRTRFRFEENASILWAGVRLVIYPPCTKELQVANEEIFSKGHFEPGNYIRDRNLLIKGTIIPTIQKRNLEYELKLVLRQPHPLNEDEDLVINKSTKIEVKAKDSGLQTNIPNPIALSLSGLNINLSKDIFKPGETIKVNFKSDILRQIEIRLLQKANLVCYCEAYGQSCRKVEDLPPAIAGDAKTLDMSKDFLLLKVPEIAEPSYNYLWAPKEKEYWGMKFGSYMKWSLLIIGKPKPEFGKESISFEVPITIVSKAISERKKEIDLFSKDLSSAPSVFDSVTSKFQKLVKVVSVDSDMEKYVMRMKNISSEKLEGVTIKVSGLQEGLFETAPILTGFKSWKAGEEKEIVYKTKQNITALISTLEDNTQRNIRVQTPVASDFF